MPASNEVSQHLAGLVSVFIILWSLFLFVCLAYDGVVSMNERASIVGSEDRC